MHDESRKKQCPYCEYRHQYKFLLEVHIDKKHPETGEKTHYCNICEKGYIFPYSAKYCMMKHKENNVSYNLYVHIKIFQYSFDNINIGSLIIFLLIASCNQNARRQCYL